MTKPAAERVAEWARAGMYPHRTLGAMIADAIASSPATLLAYRGELGSRDCRLGDLQAAGQSAAAGLSALGLRRGDAIVVQLPTCPEWIEIFYGAVLLGLRVIPVIHIYGVTELDFIIRDSGAKALFVPARWRRVDFRSRAVAASRCPTLHHVITVGESDFGSSEWAEVVHTGAGWNGEWVVEDDPDSVCAIVYTSGTTAEPKGVQHTHATIGAEVVTIESAAQQPRGSAQMHASPAGHVAALLGVLRAVLTQASISVFLDHWDAPRAVELITRYGITSTNGPPYYLSTLITALEAQGIRDCGISDYMTGGERVPPELVEEASTFGIAVYRSYGSSEHPTATTGRPGDPLHDRAHTDGIASPGTVIRVVDDNGNDLPPWEQGEILTSGPDRFIGYTNQAANETSFDDLGFFRTGDVGVLSTDGILTITDRKKDVIIRGGENLSSIEIEDILLRHVAIEDTAVVAMPDPQYGERVCAFAIVRPEATFDMEEMRRHFAAAGVAPQKTPERLEIVAALPRTLVGKIKKAELREQLRQEIESPGVPLS